MCYDDYVTDRLESSETKSEDWTRLRGALKDVFAEFGGGEAYLRQEREIFGATVLHE